MRWRMLRKIRTDDVLNGLALIFLLVVMGTWQRYAPAQYQTQLHAAGILKGPPPAYDPIDALKYASANVVLFWTTIYTVKASFLALYWEIFAAVSKRFRIAWIVLTVYISLSFAITILSYFWHCGLPADLINPCRFPVYIPTTPIQQALMQMQAACRRWKPRAITIMYMAAVLHIVGDIMCRLASTSFE